MTIAAVRVKDAERMMTSARPVEDGIEMAFADGAAGMVPFSEIPEVPTLAFLAAIELPNPYLLILRTTRGEAVEVPWDFARHYCDAVYRLRVEAVAAEGRQAIGARIRSQRHRARLTQEALARSAGIGRVTLVRIERGEQSPSLATLTALAVALGAPVEALITADSGFNNTT